MSKAPNTLFKQASAGTASGLGAEEKIGSLFGSDPLLATQFLQTMRRKTLLEPETKLMVAILEDAIDCFQANALGRDVRSRRLFNEAAAWILAAENEWVFSFQNICEHLALDPAYVRRGLFRSIDKQLAQQHTSRGWERRKIAV
ncbi:MAG TPA: hypothetical protein VIB79_08650 [Candidatus Binatia bacterium]|jgi:hypothetical protein